MKKFIVAHKVFDETSKRNLSENEVKVIEKVDAQKVFVEMPNKIFDGDSVEIVHVDPFHPDRDNKIVLNEVSNVDELLLLEFPGELKSKLLDVLEHNSRQSRRYLILDAENNENFEEDTRLLLKEHDKVECVLSQNNKTEQPSGELNVADTFEWKPGLEFWSEEKGLQNGVNGYGVIDKLEDYLGRRFRSSRRLNWNKLSVDGRMESFEDGESITYSKLTSVKEPKDGVAEVVNGVALKSVKAVKLLVFHLLENLLENLNGNLFKIYDWKSVQLVVTFFISILVPKYITTQQGAAESTSKVILKRKRFLELLFEEGVTCSHVNNVEVSLLDFLLDSLVSIILGDEGKAPLHIIYTKSVEVICLRDFNFDWTFGRLEHVILGTWKTLNPHLVSCHLFTMLTKFVRFQLMLTSRRCQVEWDAIRNILELPSQQMSNTFKSQHMIETYNIPGEIFATCYLEKWMVKNKKQVVKWWLIKWKWKKLSNRSTDIWKNGIHTYIDPWGQGDGIDVYLIVINKSKGSLVILA